jgi:hypothetical protein
MHVWIGPQVYKPEIDAIRTMVPTDLTPAEFRAAINRLTRGCFLYFNIDKKTGPIPVRIRPARTLHLAMTEIEDEELYFTGDSCDDDMEPVVAGGPSQQPVMFDFTRPMENDDFIAICQGELDYPIGQVSEITGSGGRLAKLIMCMPNKASAVPDEFLMHHTGSKSRASALDALKMVNVESITTMRWHWLESL